jgi:hypothetical protein
MVPNKEDFGLLPEWTRIGAADRLQDKDELSSQISFSVDTHEGEGLIAGTLAYLIATYPRKDNGKRKDCLYRSISLSNSPQ